MNNEVLAQYFLQQAQRSYQRPTIFTPVINMLATDYLKKTVEEQQRQQQATQEQISRMFDKVNSDLENLLMDDNVDYKEKVIKANHMITATENLMRELNIPVKEYRNIFHNWNRMIKMLVQQPQAQPQKKQEEFKDLDFVEQTLNKVKSFKNVKIDDLEFAPNLSPEAVEKDLNEKIKAGEIKKTDKTKIMKSVAKHILKRQDDNFRKIMNNIEGLYDKIVNEQPYKGALKYYKDKMIKPEEKDVKIVKDKISKWLEKIYKAQIINRKQLGALQKAFYKVYEERQND